MGRLQDGREWDLAIVQLTRMAINAPYSTINQNTFSKS